MPEMLKYLKGVQRRSLQIEKAVCQFIFNNEFETKLGRRNNFRH